jgi:hypothetical protein
MERRPHVGIGQQPVGFLAQVFDKTWEAVLLAVPQSAHVKRGLSGKQLSVCWSLPGWEVSSAALFATMLLLVLARRE